MDKILISWAQANQMKKILIFSTLLFVSFSCHEKKSNSISKLQPVISDNIKKVSEKQIKIDTTITLDFNFKIEAGKVQDFETFKTYSWLKLTQNKNTIKTFSDSLEFELNDQLQILKLSGPNNFQIIFEINDRPNKNYLLIITIYNEQIVIEQKVPKFIAPPKNLDKDSNLEVAGYWNYTQTFGVKNSKTFYNPIIFYEFTDKGILIDSALTKKINTKIYGDFKGYEITDTIVIPASVLKIRSKEINKIKMD